MLVGSDADTTKSNIEAYSKAIADSTEKAKKELLKGKAPKTTTATDNPKESTRDKIAKRLAEAQNK